MARSALYLPASALAASRASVCPFHDGPETLDALLAQVGTENEPLLDACLDLRSFMTQRASAEECLEQACRVRRLLDGQHHLAFYRVRCWLRRAIVTEVRGHRGQSWQRRSLPLDFARIDEVVHQCTCATSLTQIRFSFAEDASAVEV